MINLSCLKLSLWTRVEKIKLWKRWLSKSLLTLIALSASFLLLGMPAAWANINNDTYDGNIFVIYAGNGSLVPPKLNLVESFNREQPVLLVFYLEDSSDCKQYSQVVSQLQSYYGRAASFIPVNVDSIPVKSSYETNEPGYYYQGFVPQTVVLDANGIVVFNRKGQVEFEKVDDVLREVFDLLPRAESVELKRRTYNQFNSELTE